MNGRITSCAMKVRARLASLTIRLAISLLICPTQAFADWPDDPVEGMVSDSEDESTNGTVGMDDQGRFVVGFDTPRSFPPGGRHVYVLRFADDGSVVGAKAALSEEGYGDVHFLPSLAISRNGVVVGWLGRGAGVA